MPRPLIADRRERILDAAEALVLERGFDAMSIQSVADQAGIAKGAVYREFSSKREILDALLARSMDRTTRVSRELLGDAEHPPLSRAYAVSVQVLLDDPLMTAAFLDDHGVLGSYIDSAPDNRYRARHRSVVKWINVLQEQGALSTRVEAESLALIALLVSSLETEPQP